MASSQDGWNLPQKNAHVCHRQQVSILVKFGFSNQRLSIGFGQRIKNIGHTMDLTLQLRSHSVWQVRQTTTNDPRLPVGKVMEILWKCSRLSGRHGLKKRPQQHWCKLSQFKSYLQSDTLRTVISIWWYMIYYVNTCVHIYIYIRTCRILGLSPSQCHVEKMTFQNGNAAWRKDQINTSMQ